MLRTALFLLCLWLPGAALATSDRVTSDDAAEIRAVIHRQIDAFKRDDAREAFSLATPAVRQAFQTPEKFLDVVRMAYHVVYRPAAVVFLDMLVMRGEVVQQVQLTDRTGLVWLAFYAMQRQADGTWKTNGCHLTQPVRTIPA